MTTEKVLYRADFCDRHGEGELQNRFSFNIREYQVVKNTPQGYWIKYGQKNKYVPARCKASFAHLTKDRAIEAMLARRMKYEKILHSQIRRNKILITQLVAFQKEAGFETQLEREYREAGIVF